MTPTIFLFVVSGLLIMFLVIAKKIERRWNKQVFVLGLISKGDARMRGIYQRAVHMYTDGKEDAAFLWSKQIPMQTKSLTNKFFLYVKEKQEEYTNTMRDAKLLKRSDGGISEFFQSMSRMEKGNGVVHEKLDDGFQDR